jgi:alkaline phosphatase D
MGASLALGVSRANAAWNERREFYPEGVASGDPHPDSVLLWTRRPPREGSAAQHLTLQVAADPQFHNIVAGGRAPLSAAADWTCRVLAAGLRPSREYWYRFTDEHGFGSRVGRTLTAPEASDARPVRFTFVSCQNVTQGAQNAYRRMISEDEARAADERLQFVLHLGDFVYEIVWYPEDRPQGMYDRRIRDVVRYPHGEKISDYHVPTTVDDYRALYRGYLHDPDLQDARARWPFVCMWDNHEFSWKGWQSLQNFGGVRPAQTRKVAANQAWFEYQPARVIKTGGGGLERFEPPAVQDAPVRAFDEHGLGQERGNLAAIESLKLFRAFRWGKHVELILTDNRSFRSECVVDRPEAARFQSKDFPWAIPEEALEALDSGPPPQSMLGARQKAWFLQRLQASNATWKLWGNTVGSLDWRTDFQNLPHGTGPRWPGQGYGIFSADDWGGYRTERAEILDFVKRNGIAGFASLAGDRHAFFAGVLSRSLPPREFEPVGVEFIVGSVSAPGLFEAAKYSIAKDHPLCAAFLYQTPDNGLQPAMNLSGLHGVRASLALQQTNEVSRARALSNPEVAPHLSFLDLGGHGYAMVTASAEALDVEFVCVPRPLEVSAALAYRVTHRVPLWRSGERPKMQQKVLEGTPPLACA